MIILNYLVALSLILLSVVKTADIFVKSDIALVKLETEFVQKSKKLLEESNNSSFNNDKGNISFTAAILTSLLSMVLLFYITKMKIEYKEALYRKDSYLCLHYLNRQTEKYIKEMAIFNWSLSTAFEVMGTGVATAEATEAFKALTIARNLRHFYYLNKISNNKYCHLPETVSFLKNTPFKIQPNLTLITNVNETTIVRQQRWTYQYFKMPVGIRLKKSFCLRSEFLIENAFIPKTKHSSSEIQIADLSSLKCFSGPS